MLLRGGLLRRGAASNTSGAAAMRALSAYVRTAPREEGRVPSPLFKANDIEGADPNSKQGKEFKGAVN